MKKKYDYEVERMRRTVYGYSMIEQQYRIDGNEDMARIYRAMAQQLNAKILARDKERLTRKPKPRHRSRYFEYQENLRREREYEEAHTYYGEPCIELF